MQRVVCCGMLGALCTESACYAVCGAVVQAAQIAGSVAVCLVCLPFACITFACSEFQNAAKCQEKCQEKCKEKCKEKDTLQVAEREA